mmetsp:Transcript_20517/g.53668  ORF Transcript_20517/g.53668 Transcript_20517/m.53668 type:complete len:205 (+) Transcript_20517:777-1391(+)
MSSTVLGKTAFQASGSGDARKSGSAGHSNTRSDASKDADANNAPSAAQHTLCTYLVCAFTELACSPLRACSRCTLPPMQLASSHGSSPGEGCSASARIAPSSSERLQRSVLEPMWRQRTVLSPDPVNASPSSIHSVTARMLEVCSPSTAVGSLCGQSRASLLRSSSSSARSASSRSVKSSAISLSIFSWIISSNMDPRGSFSST